VSSSQVKASEVFQTKGDWEEEEAECTKKLLAGGKKKGGKRTGFGTIRAKTEGRGKEETSPLRVLIWAGKKCGREVHKKSTRKAPRNDQGSNPKQNGSGRGIAKEWPSKRAA